MLCISLKQIIEIFKNIANQTIVGFLTQYDKKKYNL